MRSRRPILIAAISATVVGIPSIAMAQLPSLRGTPAPAPHRVSVSSRSARARQAPSDGAIRIVAARQAVTDGAGHVWQPDTAFAVGGRLAATTDAIAGTEDQELFQPERYAMTGYRIPVAAAGTYHVQLNESENYWRSVGQRVFTVTANGSPVASDVDLERSTGFEHATSLGFDVETTTGTLVLGFSATTDNAKVDSLLVTPLTPAAAPTAVPTAVPTTGETVTPLAYGAAGDGVTDDTAALQRAFDAATPSRPVVLPAGRIFAHSGVLHLRVAGLRLTGPGTLLATNEATSSVWIEADNVTLDGGLVLRTASTTQRWSNWEQMGLRLVGHTGATLRDITIADSAAAGIYIGGADHFLLDHVTVVDTRADGIHMTDAANNGVVTDPTTVNTGDDGVAVVSYGSDPAPCHNISVTGARVLGTAGGRGMSVVGGSQITYTGFDVERTDAAGIYVAAEGAPWNSYAPTDVAISDGQINGANTDSAIDHGAIVVLGAETAVAPSGVAISGVAITNTRTTASRDVGVITYGTPPTGIAFDDLTITGGPAAAYQGNTPASGYTIRDWTVNGRAYGG